MSRTPPVIPKEGLPKLLAEQPQTDVTKVDFHTLEYRCAGAQSYADAGLLNPDMAKAAARAERQIMTAPLAAHTVKRQLAKNPRRATAVNPETQRGGLDGSLQFVRPHSRLDVWYCRAPLPDAVHNALVQDVTAIGDATRDHFVVSYQNVIDPNLCVAKISDAEIAAIELGRGHEWSPGTANYGPYRRYPDTARAAAAKAVEIAETLAKQLPHPPSVVPPTPHHHEHNVLAPQRPLSHAERKYSEWMHIATAKTGAKVARATCGAFGPVHPGPAADTPQHRDALALADTAWQYRWQATTVRVEYLSEPPVGGWPPKPLPRTVPAAAPASASPAPSASAGAAAAAGAGAGAGTGAGARKGASEAAAAAAVQAAAAAAAAKAAAAADAATEFPACRVDVCSPIQDLKRSAHEGLYRGVESIFAAAYPVLRTLWCWETPVKGDYATPATERQAHRPDTCFACLGRAHAIDAGLQRASGTRASAQCSYAPGGHELWKADVDDFGKLRYPDRMSHAQRYTLSKGSGGPHPFRALVGPPRPTPVLTHDAKAHALGPERVRAATSGGPGRTGAAYYQVVVKAQKVVIQPGATYQGVWHDEGLHERVVAAVVYYHTVPACVSGGGVQFADKVDVGLRSSSAEHVGNGWRQRSKVVVDIKERDLLVFSNYQSVHRVLAMHNSSNEPVCREFVCLFVIDPLWPVPSTGVVSAVRGHVGAAVPSLPPELVTGVLEYTGDHPSMEQRRKVRRALFTEQMRPRELGAWIIYTAGNGDCQSVVWSTATDRGHNPTYLLAGTSSDEPAGPDGYSCTHDFLRSVPGHERTHASDSDADADADATGPATANAHSAAVAAAAGAGGKKK